MDKPAAAESSMRAGKREHPRAPKSNSDLLPLAHTHQRSFVRPGPQLNNWPRNTISPAEFHCSSNSRNHRVNSRRIRCNMSEPAPIFDPPVVENGTAAAEAEGSAPPTDNGGLKENNGQDVTMAGLEESGVKTPKTGVDPAVSESICCVHHDHLIHFGRIHHHNHTRHSISLLRKP